MPALTDLLPPLERTATTAELGGIRASILEILNEVDVIAPTFESGVEDGDPEEFLADMRNRITTVVNGAHTVIDPYVTELDDILARIAAGTATWADKARGGVLAIEFTVASMSVITSVVNLFEYAADTYGILILPDDAVV